MGFVKIDVRMVAEDFLLFRLCRWVIQYTIALVSCTRRVVPNNTNPHDLKKQKNSLEVVFSGSVTAISLSKDFSHNTKNLAMIFGGDFLSKLIERITSPPLFTTPSLQRT